MENVKKLTSTHRTSIFFIFLLPALSRLASLSACQQSGSTIVQYERCTVQELAEYRDQAIIRGLEWLADFLDDPKHMLGMSDKLNSFRVFREFAFTTADPKIRTLAREASSKYAGRLKEFFIDVPNPETNHKIFMDMLEFAADRDLVEPNLDPVVLRVQEVYSTFSGDEELYGVPLSDLGELTDWEIFDLLMDAYALEKADIEFPGKFRTGFQLIDILRYLNKRKFVSFEEDTGPYTQLAQDHVYLATHICYVLSNYGRVKLYENHAPSLYRYIRRNFDFVMARKDIELVGEFIDIFRSLGYTEENDPMIRKGTEFLLNTQNPDGSWGTFDERDGPYRSIHYTWCAASGLRNRIFLDDTEYGERIRAILVRIDED